jgi:cell division protein FtsA
MRSIMDNRTPIKDDLVFGLDIGTRSIVGVVGYMDRTGFHVVAMAQKEHDTRAMLDGQIHDIYKVGDTIRFVKNELERQLERQLSDVCIAAAGRVLRTVNATAEYEFEEETRVTQEHIYSLNLLAVEKAHMQINSAESNIQFYCVGNTPIKYKLNEFDITNLEGHKANKIGVELIATFLPDEVVDGLYEAVEYAGLQVASLTLEPIAAMNIAIPQQYRLLNIGLIDVGAGTSDICLTKDGSIIAYGMIPLAGDEITEVIAKNYLVDFNTAEKIKIAAGGDVNEPIVFNDIMGIEQTITVDEILKIADNSVDTMAKNTADKIVELNGGKPVNAVFVVGGGGKITGYTDKIADYLGIARQRVAVRGPEVLTTVDFRVDNFKKDSLYVTPIGICTNYYTQKNNFIFVNVNNERIKLYDNNHLTVVDAVMQIGFPNERLFPRRGKELEFTVNGKTHLVRGTAGEGAVVTLNGRLANLNSSIEQNDIIEVKESTIGEPAKMTVGQLDEFKSTIEFVVNGKNILCPKFAYVNGELRSEFYDIETGDNIKMENYYTVKQLFEFLDYDITNYNVYVNNEIASDDTKVYENFSVKTDAVTENNPLNRGFTTGDILNEDDESEANENDEKLQNNEATEDNSDNTEIDNTENSNENDSENVSDNKDKADDNSNNQDNSQEANKKDIVILVNREPVRLKGKSSYILVDLFDFYDFDLSKPKGNVVLKLNGVSCNYMSHIKDGDLVDLYWEEVK